MSETTETTITNRYPAFDNTMFKLKLDTSYLVGYGILTFGIIYLLIEAGISSPTISFFTLAIIYSILTISLSSNSAIFVFLEILLVSAIIETFAQLDYEGISWFLVILLPFIAMATSLYYLIFFLTK